MRKAEKLWRNNVTGKIMRHRTWVPATGAIQRIHHTSSSGLDIQASSRLPDFLLITQFAGLLTMAQPSEYVPVNLVGDLAHISNQLKERRMCSSCTIDKIDVIMDEALEYEIPSDILEFMRNADDECLAGIYYLVSKEADPVDYAVSRLSQVSLFRGYLSSYARQALRNGQLGEISPNLWRYVNMRMLISDLEKTHVEFTFLGETWVSNKTNEA
jgi:hypothetical protein